MTDCIELYLFQTLPSLIDLIDQSLYFAQSGLASSPGLGDGINGKNTLIVG